MCAALYTAPLLIFKSIYVEIQLDRSDCALLLLQMTPPSCTPPAGFILLDDEPFRDAPFKNLL